MNKKIDIKDIIPILPKSQPNIHYKIERFEDCEKDYYQRLLHACKGNIDQASILSGLARATIYRNIAKYGIKRYN